jgi:hypothetical protein
MHYRVINKRHGQIEYARNLRYGWVQEWINLVLKSGHKLEFISDGL